MFYHIILVMCIFRLLTIVRSNKIACILRLIFGYLLSGVGIILDNLAKDNKDNAKFYLYLYLR